MHLLARAKSQEHSQALKPLVVNQSAALTICCVAWALGQRERTVVPCEDGRGTPGAGVSVRLCFGFLDSLCPVG